jgi:hypothetical protein
VISLSSVNSSLEIGHVAFTGEIIFPNVLFIVACWIWRIVGAPPIPFVLVSSGIVYNMEKTLALSRRFPRWSRDISVFKYLDNNLGNASVIRGAGVGMGMGAGAGAGAAAAAAAVVSVTEDAIVGRLLPL